MDTSALTDRYDRSTSQGFAELSQVRLVRSTLTDDGVVVEADTQGTVVGVWPEGAAYEVDFAAGLATVEAACLVAAE